jgi:hypothetical protein
MSDEKTNGTKPAGIHVDHWRQHPGCKKWGSFGYDRGRARWKGVGRHSHVQAGACSACISTSSAIESPCHVSRYVRKE